MGKLTNTKFLLILVCLLTFSSCATLFPQDEDNLNASGIIEAVQVNVSPEIGGRVAEVFAAEGDSVESGEVLFRLEADSLIAQRNLALTAKELAQAQLETATKSIETAQVALSAAEAGVASAQSQYELVLAAARLQEAPARVESWNEEVPREFSLPTWYFQKKELISAASTEVEKSKDAYEIEIANYALIRDLASNADLKIAEERLNEAQTAFILTEQLLDREIQREGKEEVEDFLEILHDEAEAELEAAQSSYDTLLTDQSFSDVLEARARLTVAREKYETAMDYLNSLLTGSQSRTVAAAEAGVIQAQTAVEQAQAQLSQAESSLSQAELAVAQAQANVEIIDLQIEKLNVPAATSGTIVTRNIEQGELIQPGVTAFTIARLDQLTIKVYVPENIYGQINLGDQASVKVDSYPGETFAARVVKIADQAEFTPRNVQTQEERQTIVFEITLAVNDPTSRLKPGMPADVTFE